MKSIVFIISLFLNLNSIAQPVNLECFGDDSSKWNNCRGAKVFDQTAYVGEFINGLASGQGTYTYSDGSVYVGQFKEGKEHGIGTFRCWNHGSKYVGEFKNGKKHGEGTYTYPDGVVYVGEWSEGKRNGSGVLTYTDGKIKVGLFKDDRYLTKGKDD
mgnify:FL=1